MKHYNTSISEDAMRIFNTKSFDNISSEVSPIIQPTIEIKRYANLILSSTATTTGAISISSPADKDFYVTGIQISYSKNVTCDIASGRMSVSVNIEGVSKHIIGFAVQTLTAENDSLSTQYTTPIKVDRGSTFSMSGSFTAGALVRVMNIQGYTVETTKGV